MGLGINYKLSNGNQQDVYFDREDNTMVNSFSSWGFLNDFPLKQKIGAIKQLFKQGTIKGSCIKDELYLIDDKYGFYSNGWDYQFCEYTPVEVTIESYWGETKTETQYETKHLKELELDDLYNLIDDGKQNEVNKLIDEAMEKYYAKSDNRIYYEVELNQDRESVKFYTEYKGTCFEVRITQDGYIEIFADDLECYADKYWNFKEKVEKEINERIVQYLDKNIQKLENGFVYKNNYYETFEEIKEIIEKEGKENDTQSNS